MTNKITLSSISNINYGASAATDINNNNSTVVSAINNTLSRDGTSPNQMQSSLDMDSNQIINLPAPASNNSPLRLSDLESFVGGSLVLNTVPVGGTTGQVLAKTSGTDYAMGWSNIPNPSTSTLGGIKSAAAQTSKWINSVSTAGVPSLTQPAFSDISGTIGATQLPTATTSTLGAVKVDGSSITITGGTISTSSNVPGGLQGRCELINDTTPVNIALIPYNGNNIVLWDTNLSTWVNFTLPYAVAITGAANNGSGAIRITHAVTTRPFVTGQIVSISGVGGTTEANTGLNAAWVITAVDSTHFDLNGSTFTHAYTSGGLIPFGIYARTDKIKIDNVANQAFVNGATYLVGVSFLDAACTVAELVATTNLAVPNVDPTVGFNVLAGLTNTPLLGMAYKDPTLGVQGNGASELVLTWYNRNRVPLNTTYTGNTGGSLNTPIALTVNAGTGSLKWLGWSDDTANITGVFSITSTVAANIQVAINVTGANTFSAFQGIRHSGTGVQQIVVPLPTEAINAGFFSLSVTLQTDAGTATSGAVFNSVVCVDTQF